MEEEILNRIVSVIESEDMTCDEVRCVINAIHHSQPALMEFLAVCRDDIMCEAALHGMDAGIAGYAAMWEAIEEETKKESVKWADEHGFMRAEPEQGGEDGAEDSGQHREDDQG